MRGWQRRGHPARATSELAGRRVLAGLSALQAVREAEFSSEPEMGPALQDVMPTAEMFRRRRWFIRHKRRTLSLHLPQRQPED